MPGHADRRNRPVGGAPRFVPRQSAQPRAGDDEFAAGHPLAADREDQTTRQLRRRTAAARRTDSRQPGRRPFGAETESRLPSTQSARNGHVPVEALLRRHSQEAKARPPAHRITISSRHPQGIDAPRKAACRAEFVEKAESHDEETGRAPALDSVQAPEAPTSATACRADAALDDQSR